MPDYYNIRDWVCCEPPQGRKMEVENLYNKINLMCYMLHERPYPEIYGPLVETIDHVLPRMDPHEVPDFLKDARPLVNTWGHILRGLKTAVENINGRMEKGEVPHELIGHAQAHGMDWRAYTRVELRMFFEVRFDPHGEMGPVNGIWNAFHNLKRAFLCLPWVHIQNDPAQQLVPRGVMQHQIELTQAEGNVKAVTLADFFRVGRDATDPFSKKVQAALHHGRENGILARDLPGIDGIVILGGSDDDSNWQKCNSNGDGCETTTTRSFCNLTSDGCSTVSD